MITSTANKQIKHVNGLMKKARLRREEGLFVAEGLRICGEVPPERLESLYLSESFFKSREGAAFMKKTDRVEILSDEVFSALSDTRTPQGILAVVRQQPWEPEQVSAVQAQTGKPALLFILEHLQDPGNLGTIVRAAEGAGVTGILMDLGTADIYNPKVIRSTMGSVLRVPFAYVEDLHDTLRQLKKQGVRLLAAHLDAAACYDQEDYRRDVGFLIGNEASGLQEETTDLADGRIRIPMAGRVESLNAAVAASVLMFEAARQRRENSIVKNQKL